MIIVETVPTFENMTLPRVKRHVTPKKLSEPVKRTIAQYKEAYRRVYRVYPTIIVDGKWFRIHGHTAGVSYARLKEMTTQLEYRAGPQYVESA